MEPREKYHTLMRLNADGDASPFDRAPARQYLETECHEWVSKDTLDNRSLQKHLVRQMQAGSLNALLCLRCFASHHILISALRVVSLYGKYYRFGLADIAIVTLNDDGKSDVKITYENNKLSIQRLSESRFQTLSFQILEKFDPEKAGLGVWASRLTWQDGKLKKLLKDEYGLLLVSDWALLNDTKPTTFKRLLIKNFGFPNLEKDQVKAKTNPAEFSKINAPMYQSMLRELDEFVLILEAYHAVYVVDRKDALTRAKAARSASKTNTSETETSVQSQSCPDPTSEQYARMIQFLIPRSTEATQKQLSEKFLQHKLQGKTEDEKDSDISIAEYIRRHRLKQLPPAQPTDTSTTALDRIPRELLILFDRYLEMGIYQALQTRLTSKRMKATKASQMLQALRMQYRDRLTQTEIAQHLNVPNQYTISRLIDFESLSTGIIGHMSQQLKNDIPSLADYFEDPDRLLDLHDQLELYLSVLIREDRSWRHTPPEKRTHLSQFGQALCQVLDNRYPD